MRGYRVNGLTQETSNALHVTLLGMVDLIKTLLSLNHQKYVLPGKIQSDRIEAEFGKYRQSSDGNYMISTEQVFNSLRLQRLKLFSKLDIRLGENTSECCNVDIDR